MNNTFIKSLIGITLFLILPGTVSAQSFLDKVLKGVEKTILMQSGPQRIYIFQEIRMHNLLTF